MTTDLVRIGILGAARITPKALVAAVSEISTVRLQAVAARDRGRAEEFARANGVATVLDSYQAVIESPDVDVVYNPLPINLHAPWSIAALKAGKHVLCEKPFAMNASEAADMTAAADASGQILGEAFHYRYHPFMIRVLDVIGSGVIGEVRHVEARFDISIPQPDIRWDIATGGGSLMDLGCYCVHWIRTVVGQEPSVVSAEAVEGPQYVDASMRAELSFESGATAALSSSMIADDPAIDLRIEGSAGTITAINPLAPQDGNELVIETERGVTRGGIDAGDSYAHMMRAFIDHVVVGTEYVTAGADAVANMTAIDAIYTAAGLPRRGDV